MHHESVVAMIVVNPHLVPHSQITEKWKEVKQMVQVEGTSIGHDNEICRTSFKSLLALFIYLNHLAF